MMRERCDTTETQREKFMATCISSVDHELTKCVLATSTAYTLAQDVWTVRENAEGRRMRGENFIF